MVEVLFNIMGKGCFNVYSVGSYLVGVVNLLVLEQIYVIGYLLNDLCSKSWDEFVVLDVLKMDFIIMVCDNVVGEVCLIWLG